MKLIGHFDSAYTRRVAITLGIYDLPFEHLPLATFADAEELAVYNPLRRVPTLVLDDGTVLVDSHVIVEWLDMMVGEERAVLARFGAERQAMLRWCGFASGVIDKGFSLVVERVFREGLPMWVERCQLQVSETLTLLDRERVSRGHWLLGDWPSHADILFGTMMCFVREALADVFDVSAWPALLAHSVACEALPVFRAAYKPYVLTKPES